MHFAIKILNGFCLIQMYVKSHKKNIHIYDIDRQTNKQTNKQINLPVCLVFREGQYPVMATSDMYTACRRSLTPNPVILFISRSLLPITSRLV